MSLSQPQHLICKMGIIISTLPGCCKDNHYIIYVKCFKHWRHYISVGSTVISPETWINSTVSFKEYNIGALKENLSNPWVWMQLMSFLQQQHWIQPFIKDEMREEIEQHLKYSSYQAETSQYTHLEGTYSLYMKAVLEQNYCKFVMVFWKCKHSYILVQLEPKRPEISAARNLQNGYEPITSMSFIPIL